MNLMTERPFVGEPLLAPPTRRATLGAEALHVIDVMLDTSFGRGLTMANIMTTFSRSRRTAAVSTSLLETGSLNGHGPHVHGVVLTQASTTSGLQGACCSVVRTARQACSGDEEQGA